MGGLLKEESEEAEKGQRGDVGAEKGQRQIPGDKSSRREREEVGKVCLYKGT